MHESRFYLTNGGSTLERNCSTLYTLPPLSRERCRDHRSVCVSGIFLNGQPVLVLILSLRRSPKSCLLQWLDRNTMAKTSRAVSFWTTKSRLRIALTLCMSFRTYSQIPVDYFAGFILHYTVYTIHYAVYSTQYTLSGVPKLGVFRGIPDKMPQNEKPGKMPENKMTDNPYPNHYPRPHPNRSWSSSVSLFLSLSLSVYSVYIHSTHCLYLSKDTLPLSLFLSTYTHSLYLSTYTLFLSLYIHTLYLFTYTHTHTHTLSLSLSPFIRYV